MSKDNRLDFDVTNFLSDFKIPGVDMQGLVASQQRNLEALTQANKLAYEGVQAVFKRQGEMVRQAVEESVSAAKDLAKSGTPQDALSRQTDLAKHAVERALTNSRELSEIITKSNKEAFALLNQRFNEVMDEVKDAINKTKK